jgi:hypothetical protein
MLCLLVRKKWSHVWIFKMLWLPSPFPQKTFPSFLSSSLREALPAWKGHLLIWYSLSDRLTDTRVLGELPILTGPMALDSKFGRLGVVLLGLREVVAALA